MLAASGGGKTKRAPSKGLPRMLLRFLLREAGVPNRKSQKKNARTVDEFKIKMVTMKTKQLLYYFDN